MIIFVFGPHLLKENMSRAGKWTKPSRVVPPIVGASVLQTPTILSEDISLRYLYYAYQNSVAHLTVILTGFL
jgi:hypothetical protein